VCVCVCVCVCQSACIHISDPREFVCVCLCAYMCVPKVRTWACSGTVVYVIVCVVVVVFFLCMLHGWGAWGKHLFRGGQLLWGSES